MYFESRGGKRGNVCKWLTREFASNVVYLCFPLLKEHFRCMPVRKGTFLPDLEHIYNVRFGHTWLTVSSLQLGWRLHEGDDFHPQENIDKMAKGEPLTDQVCVSVIYRTICFCHVNYCLDATDRTQQVPQGGFIWADGKSSRQETPHRSQSANIQLRDLLPLGSTCGSSHLYWL